MSYGRLSTLLEQDYYLTKVLGYLLDDGLHECRRVCRKWYDVCNRMPVKLGRISVEEIPAIVNKFPNAVSFYRILIDSLKEGARNDEVTGAIESLRQLEILNP